MNPETAALGWAVLVGLALGTLCLTAFLQPNRNRATRWLVGWIDQWTPSWFPIKIGPQLLIGSVVFLFLALAALGAFIWLGQRVAAS